MAARPEMEEDARTPLPPVTPALATARGTTPPFVRTSLQKLRADTHRPLGLGPPADAPLHYALDREGLFRTPHTQSVDPAPVATDCREDWHTERSLVRERCYLNGFLTHDLERYREAFAEELRSKLQAMQEMLRQANLAGLGGELTSRLDAIQAHGQKEVEQLRGQCTDLLRLNAQLRQQQIDTNSSHLRSTAEKISAMVATLDVWDGVDMEAVGSSIVRAMEPVKQAQQNIQMKLKRVESFNGDLVKEFRRLLKEELEPIKLGQQAMHVKLKRLEDMGSQDTRARIQLKEEMERLLEVHERRASVMDARLGQLRHSAAPGGGGVVQAAPAAGASAAMGVMETGAAMVGLSSSQTGTTELSEALGGLQKTTQEMVAALAEDRTNVSANYGKMILNQKTVLQNLQAIQSSVATLDGNLGRVTDVIEEVPGVLNLAKQAALGADMEDVEVQRLRQLLTVKTSQVAHLKKQFDDKGSAMPFLTRIRKIERRGNLRIDLRNGEVTLNRQIMFKSKRQSEPPTAEFADDGDAMEIIADLAELWDSFKVNMAIECHTKGGEGDLWQEIATNRATLVATKLQEMGVQKELVHPEGLPGKLGKNIPAVDVKLDILPEVN